MKIKDLNKGDSLKSRVIEKDKKGCYLDILDLEETIIVRLFDEYLPLDTELLVSIIKINVSNENYGYIKVKLDSIQYEDFIA